MTRAQSRLTTAGRLQRHLQVMECRYPRVWDQIDTIRRAHTGTATWPAWCHAPLARVREVVCPAEAGDDPTRLVDVAIIGGLAAWRIHQELCPSDRVDAAAEEPLDLDVPPEHLRALLDRPVYIELPHASYGSPATGATRGVLVHLTFDEKTQIADARLLLDPTRRWTLGSVPLVPIAVPLTEPTLARCLDAAVRDHARRHDRLARYAVAGEMAVALHGLARTCLGLVVQLLDPARAPALTFPELASSDAHGRDRRAAAIAAIPVGDTPRDGAHFTAAGGTRPR
jgi:hypothetical protein